MKRLQRRSYRFLVFGIAGGALVWAAGLGLIPAAGSGQAGSPGETSLCSCSAEPGDPKGDFAGGDDTYARPVAGYLDCNLCHESGIKGPFVIVAGVPVNRDKERWVLYREFPIWAEKDKHTQSYTVLLNDRSKKMGKILGTDTHRDKRCLACHTGFPISQMPADKTDKSEVLVSPEMEMILGDTQFREVKFGVTCEGCHGPSNDLPGKGKGLMGWNGPHQKSNTWRFLSPQTKRKDFGFWDVRSPASKTKICASCHVGSVEHGRIVTHEMYAAGHPPLPAFEVETFVEQMPKHWANFADKSEEVIKRFIKNTKDPLFRDGGYKKENLHLTKAMLVGALVSTSEYFNLIGDLADEKATGPVKTPGWPELAVFDCFACHHELKGPSWRQVRKPPAGVPGRPFLQEWNSALLKLALKQVGGDAPKEYEAKFQAIRQALNKQPFGERTELKKSTKAAAAWLMTLAEDFQRKQVTLEKGPELLKEIATQGSTDILDYESARQFVWGFQVVDREIKGLGAAKFDEILNPAKKGMFLLDLRSGRKAATPIPGEPEARPTIEVDLEKVLPFVANYDPSIFRERFLEIRNLLK